MVVKTYKIIIRTLLAVCLVLLLSVTSFYLWIVTGPRSISYLNGTIERGLNASLANYHFKISNTLLLWDEENKTVGLRVVGVKVHNKENQPIAAFPQLAVGLTIADIIRGQLKPTDLMVINPAFKLSLDQASSLQESRINVRDAYVGFVKELFALSRSKAVLRGVNTIRIKNADLLFTQQEKEILLRITQGYITVVKDDKDLRVTAELSTFIEDKEIKFNFLLEQQDSDTFTAHIGFTRLPSGIVAQFFPHYAELNDIHVTGDGKVVFVLSKDSVLLPTIREFELSKVSGTFSHKRFFKYPVEVTDMGTRGHVVKDFSEIVVDGLALESGQSQLSLKGFIKHNNFDLQEVSLEAEAKNVPIDEIYRYWPEELGVMPRQWVVSNIAKGMVPQASAKVFLKPEDIANHHIPEEALEAHVSFTNASVNYFPLFPPAEEVEGTANFTGKEMRIHILKGEILHSVAENVEVVIPDMQDHVRKVVNIKGNAKGPVADGMHYFDAAPVDNFLKTTLASATGEAETSVALSIPLIHPLTFNDLSIDITSKLSNASIKNIFQKYDIAKGTLDFNYNGNRVKLAGDAAVNGVPASLSIERYLHPEGNPYAGQYSFKGNLSKESAAKLRLPVFDAISGTMGAEVTITEQEGKRDVGLNLDLKDAEVTYPPLAWKKPAGVAMKATAKAGDKGGQITITGFSVDSPAIKGKGSAVINKDFAGLSRLKLENAAFGRNSFSLSFVREKDTESLEVSGKSLDISEVNYGQLFSSHNENSRQKTMRVRLDRIYMKNDGELSVVAADLQSRQGFFQKGSFRAGLPGNGAVNLVITPVTSNQSHYLLTSSNAGAVTKSMNFYKNMEGGALNIDGHMERVQGSNGQMENMIHGILKINNFTATKTPILAKIATLASLQGVVDLLGNKGIYFKRLRAPFTMKSGVVELKDARASGNALGITAEGYINTNDGTLNLEGTFVPSYTLNNILGKIPLVGAVGDVLMGGKGQGIIAARYKVKGTYANAEVSVNPLSILTPGFLRKLFDIMDSGPPRPVLKPQEKVAAVSGSLYSHSN